MNEVPSQPAPVVRVEIVLDAAGNLNVSGNLENKIVVLGCLEFVKSMLLQSQRPGNGLLVSAPGIPIDLMRKKH